MPNSNSQICPLTSGFSTLSLSRCLLSPDFPEHSLDHFVSPLQTVTGSFVEQRDLLGLHCALCLTMTSFIFLSTLISLLPVSAMSPAPWII